MSNVDVRMTFDTFVVGPGNRLASAAARRAADSPAASYNPLFLYSASGLGKSHILSAMAHHSERLNPDSHVLYQTLEGYLDELADAIQSDTQEELKDRYRDLDILLLDDVQFLTGQPEAQELLLRTLDSLNLSGSQIVLASDRPPAEIDGLDARLLSRFSGGLMVDIAPPELETRVAILRKKCEGRKAELAAGVSEQIARLPFRNVRELMGGLNRVLAAQELEGRAITPEDVEKLVDIPAERPRRARRADRLAPNVSPEFFDSPEEPWQRLIRMAAEEAEAEGFAVGRLRRVLEGEMEPSDPQKVVDDFHRVLNELRQVRSDLDVVGNPWPEAARGVLLDPDRVEEARALLASARERVRAFPPFPLDAELPQLEGRYPQLAVRAARQLITDEVAEYNPLYVWSPDGHGARMLLEATAASCLAQRPGTRVAFISAKEFADEFVDALSEGVAGAWRERWWTVELLLIHGCQQLSETERAQDEFFHLFEAVKRRGARVVLGADRSPSGIENIDDRLRSRFEGGLVVQADVQGVPPTPIAELLLLQGNGEKDLLEPDLTELDEGGEVGPDLQVRRNKKAGTPDNASSDPQFERSLEALDGGSEEAAWTVPKAAPAARALTNLTVRTDDFPTLLSEKEKERARAGTTPIPTEEAQSSGEAMAPESAIDGPSSEAADTSLAPHEGSSSEADPFPPGATAPSAGVSDVENAPIVTAADLPGTSADQTSREDVVGDTTLDSTESKPEAPAGPWVAEALPAVLENDLDSAIEALFGRHQPASVPDTEPDPPETTAAPETGVAPEVVRALESNGAPETAQVPAPAPPTAAEPHRAPAEPAPAADSPQPPAPSEPSAPLGDSSHLDDVLLSPAAPAADPFDFGSSGESGVATRTRARRTHQVDVAEPARPVSQAPVAETTRNVDVTQEIDAAAESNRAVQPSASASTVWTPSREETVWDWPSIAARIVVEE